MGHAGSLAEAREVLLGACSILFPNQGWNPGLLPWELGVLVTGPPGKSLTVLFKVAIEDEMVDGITRHESEQAPRDGDGQGGLSCCSPRGRKESDTTVQLNHSNILPSLSLYHILLCLQSIYHVHK